MRTLPTIPPPTPVGVTESGRRYPAPLLGLSGRVVEVLRELRAADAVMPPSPSAMSGTHDRGTWLPASVGLARVPLTTPRPLPTRDLIERLTAVSTAMHADHARHLDTLAVLDGISAAIANGADAHVVRMAPTPVEALLEPPLPGSDWAANPRAVLPVAMPKVEVA